MGHHTLAVGHRGAPLAAVENTLASIDVAIAAGADWVEVDVWLTRDRVPVLLHDRTLDRIWGIPRPVADLDAADLPGRAGSELTPGADHRIPTLREALDFVRGRGTRLLIDIRGLPEAAASVVTAAELGRMDEVAFTGNPEGLALVREAAPAAVMTMTWDSPVQPGAELLGRVRPQYINQPWPLLDPAVIDTIHASGLLAATYTVDDRERMRDLADADVDAITSNDIAALVPLLREHAGGKVAEHGH